MSPPLVDECAHDMNPGIGVGNGTVLNGAATDFSQDGQIAGHHRRAAGHRLEGGRPKPRAPTAAAPARHGDTSQRRPFIEEVDDRDAAGKARSWIIAAALR
jgi:hypothetical protein